MAKPAAAAGNLSIAEYQVITYQSWTAGNKSFPSITWVDGDLIIIFVSSEDLSYTAGTPTVAGLTFNAVSGFPLAGGSNHCWLGAWSATAAGGGSGAISVSHSSVADMGASLWRFQNHGGIGNIATSQPDGSDASVSLTVSQGSAVVACDAEWNAVNTTYTGTPTVNVERRDGLVADGYHGWVADWLNQSSGTRDYGKTTTGATRDTWGIIEIRAA